MDDQPRSGSPSHGVLTGITKRKKKRLVASDVPRCFFLLFVSRCSRQGQLHGLRTSRPLRPQQLWHNAAAKCKGKDRAINNAMHISAGGRTHPARRNRRQQTGPTQTKCPSPSSYRTTGAYGASAQLYMQRHHSKPDDHTSTYNIYI